ncbi:MAG TPA: cytochrome c3 family protein [Verrucomicrobiae bacterium]|nr:cytochrome c3 family protein [Verrucomicrobiae bacterium]
MTRTKLLLIGILAVLVHAIGRAQSVEHLAIPVPGGFPGRPILTGATPTNNGLSVTWDGPSGYYQLFESHTLVNPKWTPLGKATNLVRRAIVTGSSTNGFFRVAGPASHYAGSAACLECHSATVNQEAHTLHASAFQTAPFVAEGGPTNASCVVCHTVGAGLPTGFVSAAKTPRLTGVQCESCHGPAANHAANPDDPAVRPRVEVAATVCAGCHNDPTYPLYDEWKSSDHAQVVEDFNASSKINACGRCHSGPARLSLLEGTPLPTGDANIGIVCATCHHPHQVTANPAQLRNPLASTNDYFISTNGAFLSQYNPKVNLCAQCHNHAGASWTNSDSAPHRSPQYNMLLGTIGELSSGARPYQPGSHALLLTNQCVTCHMQTTPASSAGTPALMGHTFRVEKYDVCLKCHPFPQSLATFAMGSVSNQIQRLKFDLDFWATYAAPPALYAKYGARSWEFTTPGELSPGGPGPTAAEQKLIPANIRKARFNLYVVLSDGSFGVHNGLYAITLLNTAEDWIEEEFDP